MAQTHALSKSSAAFLRIDKDNTGLLERPPHGAIVCRSELGLPLHLFGAPDGGKPQC